MSNQASPTTTGEDSYTILTITTNCIRITSDKTPDSWEHTGRPNLASSPSAALTTKDLKKVSGIVLIVKAMFATTISSLLATIEDRECQEESHLDQEEEVELFM